MPFSPFLNLKCLNNPRPSGDGVNAGGILFEVSQGVLQVILQGIETVEHPIVERLLPKFVPEMFDRIQVRGIGWQRQQPKIGWQRKPLALVPPGPIQTITIRSFG